jgi:RNA polymerase sigma-70 factor (ECF subfamily)
MMLRHDGAPVRTCGRRLGWWMITSVGDMTAEDGDITGMLAAARGGDAEAAQRLAGLVYEELRRRAESLMKRESPGHTVQATMLIHDAYLKLIQQDRVGWNDRNHFFAVAAQTMRRLLVDHARGRQRDKRGGGQVKVSLEEGLGLSSGADGDVLAVDRALARLEALDPQQARIVELRFFGGLTVEEVAQQLGMSKRSVEAEWTMVAAWLRRELRSE